MAISKMIYRKIKLSATLVLVFGLITWVHIGASAQNITFSQYNDASFYVNPAFIATKSEISVSFLHRNQQLNNDINFNTSALTATYAFINKNNKRTGGVGLSAVRDVQVGDGAFKLQGVSAVYAYNLQVANQHYISFGMQAGYFERKINSDGFTTGSQWIENVGFDRTAPLGESFLEDRKSYFTLSAGINYYIEDENERQVFNLGFSTYHLNRPVVSFYDNEDKLFLRHTANLYVALLKNNKMIFGPQVLYINQNNESLLSPGAAMSYYFKSDNPFSAIKSGKIDLNARYTIDQALIMGIQFHQPNFSVGFSYDFGTGASSSLAGNTNASEFLITVRKSLGRKSKNRKVIVNDYTIGEIRDFYANEETPVRYFNDDNLNNEPEEQTETVVEDFDWSEENHQFELRKDFSFGFNEAELNQEAKAYLLDIVKLLKSNNKLYLEVIGHTDNIGTADANMEVALSRAKAVEVFLLDNGINNKRLKTTGKGATEPLVENNNEKNRSKNRRVEFVIYTR